MEQLRLLVQLLPWVVAVIAVVMAFKMEDRYSRGLLAIMSSLIFFGLLILIGGYFIFGTVLLVLGMMMASGIKTPKSPPKTIFLMTFFGKPTESISEGLTMTLSNEWLEVVGTIEVPVELREETVTIPEEIRCNNSVPIGGTVSIGFIVDIKDDGNDKTNPKTKGQKVNAFVRNGQVKGIMETIRGSVIQAVKEIARDKDPEYMETQSKKIGEEIRTSLENGIPKRSATSPTPEDLISLLDFGVDVNKIGVSFTAPKNVRDARADIAVEHAQRESQLADTKTMSRRVLLRMSETYNEIKLDTEGNLIGDKPTKLGGQDFHVVFAKIRTELIEEQALNDGRYQVVKNQGGVNILNANAQGQQQGGRGGGTP